MSLYIYQLSLTYPNVYLIFISFYGHSFFAIFLHSDIFMQFCKVCRNVLYLTLC